MKTIAELLAPIKERLAKATPGPIIFKKDEANNDALFWKNHWDGTEEVIARLFWPSHPWFNDAARDKVIDDQVGDWWEGFGQMCANAPTDLAKLIAALERADAAMKNLLKVLAKDGGGLLQCGIRDPISIADMGWREYISTESAEKMRNALTSARQSRADIAEILKGEER